MRHADGDETEHEADIDDSSDGGVSSSSGGRAGGGGNKSSSLAIKLARLATAATRSGYSTDTTAAGGDDGKGGYEKVASPWQSSVGSGSGGRLSPTLSTASSATIGSGHGHFINALLQAAGGSTNAGQLASNGSERDDQYAQMKALEAGEISQRRQQSPIDGPGRGRRPTSTQPSLRNERYSRDGLYED